MADHARRQCRDRIVTLVTGLSATGANVLKNVVYDIERLTLPAIGVAEGAEVRTPVTMPAPRVMECACDFDVTVYAEDNTDCEATLDEIAKQIEEALASPVTGPWKELTLTQTAPRLDGTAQKIRGRRVLRYRANYRIRENAPDVAL